MIEVAGCRTFVSWRTGFHGRLRLDFWLTPEVTHIASVPMIPTRPDTLLGTFAHTIGQVQQLPDSAC